jgi:hypothetical protein
MLAFLHHPLAITVQNGTTRDRMRAHTTIVMMFWRRAAVNPDARACHE